MRTGRFVGRLLAGTVLALIVAAPTPGISAPERVQSAQPLPPSLNGQRSYRQRMYRQRTTPRRHPASRSTRSPRHDARSHAATERYQTIQRNAPSALQERTAVRREATPATPPRAALPVPPAAQPAVQAPAEAATGALALVNSLDRPLAANDAAIIEALRTILTTRTSGKGIAREGERKAIQDFYAAHSYAPLWIRNGTLTPRARTVIARLQNAAADALSAAEYPVPPFHNANSAAELAKGDIGLTYSLLTFARHLSTGRIAPGRVFAQVDYGDHTPDPAAILKTVFEARDVDAAIESFNPPAQSFRALKQKLAELIGQGSDETSRIPDGPIIRPGKKDDRIPLIRTRVGLMSRKPDDTTYDRRLYNVIRGIQHNNGLRPSGIIGEKTLAAINGPKRAQVIDTVKANMERWRWLPRDLGDTYVMVNVPDFSLKLVDERRVVWTTKIVVGKPQTPTPLVSAWMDTVIVNPSWYVPQSIIHNELLPRYETDPNIFDRMGLEVKKGPDGHINVVQPPGAANALGRIKFNFHNKFLVYLHDTPEKRLFNYSQRAFSHGCMRVENPTRFGEMILSLSMGGQRTPNSREIQAMFGQEQHDFRLMKRPRVHLTYQTAYVDESGKLRVRDDIYGFDSRIRAILNSDERRVADVAPPPDPTRDLETLQANQEILRRVERREAGNPFVFFERLFR